MHHLTPDLTTGLRFSAILLLVLGLTSHPQLDQGSSFYHLGYVKYAKSGNAIKPPKIITLNSMGAFQNISNISIIYYPQSKHTPCTCADHSSGFGLQWHIKHSV